MSVNEFLARQPRRTWWDVYQPAEAARMRQPQLAPPPQAPIWGPQPNPNLPPPQWMPSRVPGSPHVQYGPPPPQAPLPGYAPRPAAPAPPREPLTDRQMRRVDKLARSPRLAAAAAAAHPGSRVAQRAVQRVATRRAMSNSKPRRRR